ncbi:MAG: DUF169 domain-containing protein [Promethearchaeia archaeon]
MNGINIYKKVRKKINLKYYSVGVKLITNENKGINSNKDFKVPKNSHRYCEFVKRASEGEFLKISKEKLSCVTSQIMLGFKKPRKIKMDMRMDLDNLDSVILFPLDDFPTKNFDSIVLRVNPKHAMDIIEAYRKVFHKPLEVNWGLYSGICSEITASVIKNQDINFSFLCSGSRIYTGFDDCELMCGIYNALVEKIFKKLIEISNEREMDLQLVNELDNYENKNYNKGKIEE